MEDKNINQENMDQNISQSSEQNSDKLQEISQIYNPQPQYKSQSNTDYDEIIVEMSPIGYYILAFQKYASFSGRSTRSEYWYFTLLNGIVFILVSFISKSLNIKEDIGGIYTLISSIPLLGVGGGLGGIYTLISSIPLLAVTARRLHDVGKTGWLQLLGILAPLVFVVLVILMAINRVQSVLIILIALSIILICISIWLFILYITNSTPGDNKYGPNPKGIQA